MCVRIQLSMNRIIFIYTYKYIIYIYVYIYIYIYIYINVFSNNGQKQNLTLALTWHPTEVHHGFSRHFVLSRIEGLTALEKPDKGAKPTNGTIDSMVQIVAFNEGGDLWCSYRAGGGSLLRTNGDLYISIYII